MKYNRNNLYDNVPKMRKLGLIETKKPCGRNQLIHFYDLSPLDDKVPNFILNNIKEHVEKSNYNNTFIYFSILNYELKYEYFIQAEFTLYNIISDTKGKLLYRIMECTAIKIDSYQMDNYYFVNPHSLPDSSIIYGKFSLSVNSPFYEIIL